MHPSRRARPSRSIQFDSLQCGKTRTSLDGVFEARAACMKRWAWSKPSYDNRIGEQHSGSPGKRPSFARPIGVFSFLLYGFDQTQRTDLPDEWSNLKPRRSPLGVAQECDMRQECTPLDRQACPAMRSVNARTRRCKWGGDCMGCGIHDPVMRQ
jgi:hypothetical protein